jgi:hypothetical protein
MEILNALSMMQWKSLLQLPKNVLKIVLGDFIAQVGFENQERMVIGRYSLHKESNDIGLGL